METLIKRRVEYCYISGAALKAQRKAAGLSQQALADLIKAATGIEVGKSAIWRMEHSFEFPTDVVMATTIQKILS